LLAEVNCESGHLYQTLLEKLCVLCVTEQFLRTSRRQAQRFAPHLLRGLTDRLNQADGSRKVCDVLELVSLGGFDLLPIMIRGLACQVPYPMSVTENEHSHVV
jgi:hypothetical protein